MEKTAKRTKYRSIKVLALCAAFLMLLVGVSLLHVGTEASATVKAQQTITLSSPTVNRGAEFDVDVSIDHNEGVGIQAVMLKIKFDPSAMTLLGATAEEPPLVAPADPDDEVPTWAGSFTCSGADADGSYKSYGTKAFLLVWASGSKLYSEGKIATLHFASKATATVGEHTISVEVDEDNTLLALKQKRTMDVYGGVVDMDYAAYRVVLLNNPENDVYEEYGSYEDNDDGTTADANALANIPTKNADNRYSYTFRSWKQDKVETVNNHTEVTYKATYTKTPVPHDITFKTGLRTDIDENTYVVSYDETEVFENVVFTPSEYEHTVSVPYAKIINYDAEVPATFSPYYSFHGWYKDAQCTIPVDFVVMKDSDQTVYGYFGLNVDEPSVTTTELKVETEFVKEGGDDYVIATVNVTKNLGINSILFTPTFDSEKLEFVGFKYENDSPFHSLLTPTFPDGEKDETGWQSVDLGSTESIADKAFLFLNAQTNVFERGKLIKLKFKVVAAGESTIGLSIGERSLTRYDAAEAIYYANAIVEEATVNVIRVDKPTTGSAMKTYTYVPGGSVTFDFDEEAGDDKGDAEHYTLSGATNTNVGEYTATAKLKSYSNTLVTWDDGSVEDISSFAYKIEPFAITKPVQTGEYEYDGTEQTFSFTDESLEHSEYNNCTLYTISDDKGTTAGSYTVTVSIVEAYRGNCVWKDETGAAATADRTYTFVIKRIRVVAPTPSDATYSFNPGTKVPLEYNNDGADVTYAFKAEDADSKDHYTVSDKVQSTVGTHKVTITLKDKDNTEWADNDNTVDTDDLKYDFVIGAFALDTPTVLPKEYTGEPLTADVTLYDTTPFYVETQTPHTDVDTYVGAVVFTIKDEYKTKYTWKTPITDKPLSTKADFVITGGLVNAWTTNPYVNDKTYDGTPAEAGAEAKYGNVIIEYRLQSEPDGAYTKVKPVNAGVYYARFSVPADEHGAYTALTWDPVPFEIKKVRLNKPVEYTDADENKPSYVYSNGAKIVYAFKQETSAEMYTVTGKEQTEAGKHTVTVSIKEAYRANYIWKGETEAQDTAEDQTYDFVIAKAQLTIPVPETRTYIFNGQEQTFSFSVVEYSDKYTILNNKQTAVGEYTVTARISNDKNKNYEWADGSTDDKTFPFEIRYAAIVDSTENDEITVSISAAGGFPAKSEFTVTKTSPNAAELLATIAAAEKVGALGQLTAAEAAAAVTDKCLIASVRTGLSPVAGTGAYTYKVTLSVARTGVTALRLVGDTVEVFAVTREGDSVSFTSDGIGDFVILADHSYVYEVVAEEYLVHGPTCEEPALYYKSCSCGGTDHTDTFTYGEPAGHDYDMTHIEWTWVDHTSVTAKVVCLKDPTHIRVFSGDEITMQIERTPATPDTNGKVVRTASITYKGHTYSDTDEETLSAGHVFTNPTAHWKKTKTATSYSYTATFICDCGETSVDRDATVTVDTESKPTKIIYTATVIFQGITYTTSDEIDRPVIIFDFADGTDEISYFLLPGESVSFADGDAHEREGYLFVGWRDDDGTLIVKDATGAYIDYKVGFESVRFTAEWKTLIPVKVSVTDTDGSAIARANVALYEDGVLVFSVTSSTTGEATFPAVPNGNYKLVVTYPYIDGADIVRSSYIDVVKPKEGEEGIEVNVVLPRSKFNTYVEGVGSAEGLEGAISEEERAGISDEGSVNEIVITQKRTTNVSEPIKEQISAEVRLSSEYRFGQLVDYYDVTMVETKTERKADGEQKVTIRTINVAEKYQTNIFPITTKLREEIAAVNGTADNIFVYKRHDYGADMILIYDLPKYSQEEGENAETECYFIKRVGGLEYIAVRQKEYSVLAFGVSASPILLTNAIDVLTIEDWTYGETANTPTIVARYGGKTAKYFYATERGGEYTAEVPTEAGVYYLKAVIEATEDYAGAMKADVPFEIHKKKLSDIGEVTFEDKAFWFNGKRHSIEISGDLPEGVTVEYIGNAEWELGKFTVTAVFVSSNTNYDVSDPMQAVMHIRLNWIPILILIIIALVLLVVVIVIVEKLLKKEKESRDAPPPEGANAAAESKEEGSNND